MRGVAPRRSPAHTYTACPVILLQVLGVACVLFRRARSGARPSAGESRIAVASHARRRNRLSASCSTAAIKRAGRARDHRAGARRTIVGTRLAHHGPGKPRPSTVRPAPAGLRGSIASALARCRWRSACGHPWGGHDRRLGARAAWSGEHGRAQAASTLRGRPASRERRSHAQQHARHAAKLAELRDVPGFAIAFSYWTGRIRGRSCSAPGIACAASPTPASAISYRLRPSRSRSASRRVGIRTRRLPLARNAYAATPRPLRHPLQHYPASRAGLAHDLASRASDRAMARERGLATLVEATNMPSGATGTYDPRP